MIQDYALQVKQILRQVALGVLSLHMKFFVWKFSRFYDILFIEIQTVCPFFSAHGGIVDVR